MKNKSLSPEERQKDVWTVHLILSLVVFFAICFFVLFLLSIILLKVRSLSTLKVVKAKLARNRELNRGKKQAKIVGFFHPNCDHGAGGEKVLWTAIKAMQTQSEPDINTQILLYSASDSTLEVILAQVQDRFGLEVEKESLSVI